MNGIEDVMDDLTDRAARDQAAAGFLRRLGDFLRGEEARGYGIDAEIEIRGAGVLHVEFGVDAPAGEVGADALDVIERPARVSPVVDCASGAPVEVVEADAPVAVEATEPKSRPARWTEDEDVTAVRMAVAGRTAREIAAELGRPVPGTQYRLYKVLGDRIAAAKGGAAPQPAAPPQPAPPSGDFTPDDDARLRGYMDDGLGIGGAAAVLRKPRDVVAARWAQLQTADAA